jgi:hypothetical protein
MDRNNRAALGAYTGPKSDVLDVDTRTHSPRPPPSLDLRRLTEALCPEPIHGSVMR